MGVLDGTAEEMLILKQLAIVEPRVHGPVLDGLAGVDAGVDALGQQGATRAAHAGTEELDPGDIETGLEAGEAREGHEGIRVQGVLPVDLGPEQLRGDVGDVVGESEDELQDRDRVGAHAHDGVPAMAEGEGQGLDRGGLGDGQGADGIVRELGHLVRVVRQDRLGPSLRSGLLLQEKGQRL